MSPFALHRQIPLARLAPGGSRGRPRHFEAAIVCVLSMMLVIFSNAAHANPAQLYVSANGTGNGLTPDSPADYRSGAFWNNTVNFNLDFRPINVTFLDGAYTNRLDLQGLGNPNHQLVLQSETQGGAVFDDGGQILISGGTNIAVRSFGFTGNHLNPDSSGGRIFKLRARDFDGTPSSYIRFENNEFYDSPTYYGAMGVLNGSHHVTIADNHVRNVGHDGHAHMVYNSHDANHVKVINNYFEDVPGDYVRFSDHSDFGEVRGNTFVSTGTPYNFEFVHMTVFNTEGLDQTHASNYLIRDNTFTYQPGSSGARRNAMGYHSSGYDPVSGLRHLIYPHEADILNHGTPEQKRQLMMELMEIDLAKVRLYNNEYAGEIHRFVYHASPRYGAPDDGYWTGYADIYDAVTKIEQIMPGDVYSDGVLDERDVELFLIAYHADDERAFLYDDRVWFGDWQAADMLGDGQVGFDDLQPFVDLLRGHVSEESLAPIHALIPEPSVAAMLVVGGAVVLVRRRRHGRDVGTSA